MYEKLGLMSNDDVEKLCSSVKEEEVVDLAMTKTEQNIAGCACVAAAASLGFV